MFKKRCFLLFTILFFLCQKSLSFGKNASLTAMITSDLHFTSSASASTLILPAMAYVTEITDAMVEEVIVRKPDVFIMTGDNTNNGDLASEMILAEKLRKIKDAGICVIVTTGNHDMTKYDPAEYDSVFSGLFDAADKDPASLSYTTVIGNVVFIAMDDNSLTLGREGCFSQNTMGWLEEMLKKYSGAGYDIVFLSHHNVLLGMTESETEASSYYRIRNKELPDLLAEYHTGLIFTGHLHSQIITEYKGMYEIISSMPVAGSHMIGLLEIFPGSQTPEDKNSPESISGNGISGNGISRNEFDTFRYHIERIDFETCGREGLAEELGKCDGDYGNYYRDSLETLVKKEAKPGEDPRAILELIKLFFVYYSDGVIFEHREELLSDPSYEPMIRTLWNYNYGPWIKETVENIAISSAQLEGRFSGTIHE